MRTIYVDPSYQDYYADKLLTAKDSHLNRDGSIEPFIRLKTFFNQQGIAIHTADLLTTTQQNESHNEYYSLGIINNYKKILAAKNAELKAFIIFEPPVVAPHLYRELPTLTAAFESVYIHNISGDGYSLHNVNKQRLKKLHWPMPYGQVLEPYWSNNKRKKRIVVINGNHRPRLQNNELYSRRIEAMTALAKFDAIDLYGRGWDRWWSLKSCWLPYWKNYRSVMQIYKGACDSKFPVLSEYQFCLCFENMMMAGYITEKIFDCFYAGTIPLYLGASDIENYIPTQAYIDCRKFTSWEALWDYVQQLSEPELAAIKEAGREFIQSDIFQQQYFRSLEQIFSGNA